MEHHDPVQVYPLLPASTSGDLWHLASAAILQNYLITKNECGKSLNPNGLRVIPVIFIDARALTREGLVFTRNKIESEAFALANSKPNSDPTKNAQEAKKVGDDWYNEALKQHVQGPVTFNFLKNLGLDCLALAVEDAPTTGTNSEIQGRLWAQDDSFFDALFEKQKKLPNYGTLSFMSTLTSGVGKVHLEELGDKKVVLPTPGKRSLHYHSGTTAAFMPLCDPKTRQARRKALQIQLNAVKQGVVKLAEHEFGLQNDDVDGQAAMKFDEFMGLVNAHRKDNRQVIIYNNRGNLVNEQTNSKPAIYNWLVDHVKDHFLVIVINTGGPQLEHPIEFDLFEKKTPPKDAELARFSPGIDPLVTCRFFKKVAEHPEIVFGMFSGRSGSCDVAAFNGVNCFYWDTPYLDLAAYDPDVCASFGFDAELLKNYERRDDIDPLYVNPEAAVQAKALAAKKEKFDIAELKKTIKDAYEKGHAKLSDGNGLKKWLERGAGRAEVRSQLAQTYRTLQQSLIMAVGYPARAPNEDQGFFSWQAMRTGNDQPFTKWLSRKAEDAFDDPKPLCPRRPNLTSKEVKYLPENRGDFRLWIFWDTQGPTKVATDLPTDRGALFEAEGKVNGVDWAIRADALIEAGFRPAPKVENEV
ncbi:hypothetical protein K491DRAFT_684553 [Lophiostoma macrostomum CBS 122681]|uniref:Uncharacterized protein n=1 Tax=Lophiostoma macrostomum CBS 122681 TaxID=1314788 RepID=A0A6A6SL94_9PLEO|nr:hypothetical protein K491DRAFT_684553 [Lophiostoma macrostomum CBS 122681]